MVPSAALTDAILSAVEDGAHPSIPAGASILSVCADPTFKGDGFSGSEVIAVTVTAEHRGGQRAIRVITKRWAPSAWLQELTGVRVWTEILLHESGVFDRANAIAGLRVPVIGSFRVNGDEWILMEDVSPELATWKQKTEDSSKAFWRPTHSSLSLYAELLDRIARFHAAVDLSYDQWVPLQLARHLQTQERTVRGTESMMRDWFGPDGDVVEVEPESDAPADPKGSPWASKTTIAADRRKNFVRFLDRLSEGDRKLWLRTLTNRDSLVTASAPLPRTLLHGDLSRRNIGLRPFESESEYILIDWEAATSATHAIDVVGLIMGKAFAMNEITHLETWYLDRYRHHGGNKLQEETWRRSVDLATAATALNRLPHFGELVRKGGIEEYPSRIDTLTERATRCISDLTSD